MEFEATLVRHMRKHMLMTQSSPSPPVWDRLATSRMVGSRPLDGSSGSTKGETLGEKNDGFSVAVSKRMSSWPARDSLYSARLSRPTAKSVPLSRSRSPS